MRKNLRNSLIIVFTVITCLSLILSGFGYAISNGQSDGNDHPYVCIILAYNGDYWYYGSGIQISQTVVLTAGHVTDGAIAVSIFFDSDAMSNPDFPYGGLTGTPYTHDDYCARARWL